MSFGEKLAISKVIVFVPRIHLKGYSDGRISNTGIKGHSIALKCSQEDIMKSYVSSLPRTDLGDVIHISLFGKKEMLPIAQKILAQGDLRFQIEHIVR